MSRRCTTHHMCDCTAERMRELEAQLRDSVPRSRIEAMEREIAAAEAKLAKVRADAGAEIERLSSKLEECEKRAQSNNDLYQQEQQ